MGGAHPHTTHVAWTRFASETGFHVVPVFLRPSQTHPHHVQLAPPKVPTANSIGKGDGVLEGAQGFCAALEDWKPDKTSTS